MRHVDGRDARLLLQFLKLDTQLLAQLGVQVGQGLIQQKDVGAHDQRACDRHALLLATRESGNTLVQLLGCQVDLAGHRGNTLSDLVLATLAVFRP